METRAAYVTLCWTEYVMHDKYYLSWPCVSRQPVLLSVLTISASKLEKVIASSEYILALVDVASLLVELKRVTR